MRDITVWLGVIAGLMHVAAFVLYNKQMLRGTSVPNTATWTLWAFLTVLNVSSYAVMSEDLVKSILPAASSLACVATFLFSWYKGKLKRIDIWEGRALALGLVSGIIWWWFKSATYANLILQLSVAISFVPTYRGVWKNPAIERALPWYIWSAAYVLSIVVIAMRWREQYVDLVYPINCLILHVAVGLLTLKKIPATTIKTT